MELTLKALAKVGFFVTSAAALLVLGGILTTIFCSLTSICTVTYEGLGGINKETVRSYMTPDRITAAASFVQTAIDKYQRLQKTVNKKNK